MRHLLILISLLSTLSFIGCRDESDATYLIDRAESLLKSDPDSSLILLDSIAVPDNLSDKLLARWCMLYGRVADTLYTDLPYVQQLRRAQAYYKSHGTKQEQAKIGLYLGRSYVEDKENEKAMKVYLQALDIAVRCQDYNQAGYICSYMGDLYDFEGDYLLGKDKYKEAESYFRKAGNMRSSAFALQDIGRMYAFSDSLDIHLYQQNLFIKKKKLKILFLMERERSLPTLYIVNYESKGFSIISADKRVYPILGFSDEGEFSLDNAPEVVTLWLEWVSEHITRCRNQNFQPDPMITSMWNSAECPEKPLKMVNCDDPDHTSQIVKGPYLKTSWNQRNNYNKYCPTNCPVGCTAVAIGQIMRFWEYPKSYNWAAMSFNNATDVTARFLAELGNKDHLNMDYTPNGSSARNTVLDNVLRGYGYNASREKYNYAKVKSEIFSGRPVILSGVNQVSGSGHAWVCDGIQIYNSTMYSYSMLHMNFGNSEKYNGYYQLDNWSYIEDGKLIFDYTTNFFHRMIISIYPK